MSSRERPTNRRRIVAESRGANVLIRLGDREDTLTLSEVDRLLLNLEAARIQTRKVLVQQENAARKMRPVDELAASLNPKERKYLRRAWARKPLHKDQEAILRGLGLYGKRGITARGADIAARLPRRG